MKRTHLELALNLGTAVAISLASYVIVTERLIPAWKDLAVIRDGDRVSRPVELISLTADTVITIPNDRPMVLTLFRSTCPACTRAAPVWRDLALALPEPVAFVAIALEASGTALEYASLHLPRAILAKPTEPDDFVARFDIRAVPTTLVIDGAGRLQAHRTGPLDSTDIPRLVELAR